jgi:hypothetical protein
LNPVFGLAIGHRLPPFIAFGDQWLSPGETEGEPRIPTRRNNFGHRLSIASDYHNLTFLDQLEETGQLGFRLTHVYLHNSRLVLAGS